MPMSDDVRRLRELAKLVRVGKFGDIERREIAEICERAARSP